MRAFCSFPQFGNEACSDANRVRPLRPGRTGRCRSARCAPVRGLILVPPFPRPLSLRRLRRPALTICKAVPASGIEHQQPARAGPRGGTRLHPDARCRPAPWSTCRRADWRRPTARALRITPPSAGSERSTGGPSQNHPSCDSISGSAGAFRASPDPQLPVCPPWPGGAEL